MWGLYLQQADRPIESVARARSGGITHCRLSRVPPQNSGRFCVASGVLRACGGGGSSLPLGVHVLGGKLPRTRLFWMSTGVVAVILVLGTFATLRYTAPPEPSTAAFSEFLSAAAGGQVTAVEVDADALTFQRADGSRFITVAPQG